jgi:hypothetical protein
MSWGVAVGSYWRSSGLKTNVMGALLAALWETCKSSKYQLDSGWLEYCGCTGYFWGDMFV